MCWSPFLKVTLGGVILMITGLNSAQADEKSANAKKQVRKHDAHDHGSAKLDIAVDGMNVVIEFESPAHDIYGFEHKPKSEAEKKKVADVNKKLVDEAASLFSLPSNLGCKVTSASVEAGAEHHDEHDHARAKKADKHGHKEEAKDKKAAKVEKEVHSDVDFEVKMTCTVSPVGAKMKVSLAKAFGELKKIKVQVPGRTSSVVGKSELTLPEEEVQL